jgi:branched-chain amino acid transport system substrate-binding protein
MSKIKQTDLDAVYFSDIVDNNPGQLVKGKIGAGMSNENVAFVGPVGIFLDSCLSAAGDTAEGTWVIFGGLPASKLSAEGQKFVERYKKEYNEDIQPYTAYAYEAANVMLDAIQKAYEKDGEVTREGVLREVFATEDYKGVLCTWSFDEDGDTTLTTLSLNRVGNGEFVYKRTIDAEW